MQFSAKLEKSTERQFKATSTLEILTNIANIAGL